MTNQKHTKVLLSEVHQTKSASFAELRNYDLEHYERISLIAHEWHAGVPRAIKFYRDESKSIADLRTQLTAVTKQRDELRDELTKMQTFMTMLNKPEQDFLEWTQTLDEHPEEYDGPCYCDLCKSYAD